ncbi:amylo-alpha-1,6-glucosidase [soil metagenome]
MTARYETHQHGGAGLEDLLHREWIATNQLGGYASSTEACFNTRKYHGLLVAAMSPPVRRMVLLSRIEEKVIANKIESELACSEYPGTIHPEGFNLLRAFSPTPFPRWAYQSDGWTLEKELRLLRGSNTVCISYTLLGARDEITLELRPLFALRGMHELMYQWNATLDAEEREFTDAPASSGIARLHRVPATSRSPEVFFAHNGELEPDSYWYLNTIYRREIERGYAGLEDLWNPGVIRYTLRPGQTVHFICSAEPIDFAAALKASAAMSSQLSAHEPSSADESLELLRRAADQFVIKLSPTNESAAATSVAVMSNYPWSAPSLRDALIAFSGLFLVTRRFAEARAFLTMIASKLNGGLLPTELPEDGTSPLYDGADTSLWFVHAVQQFMRYTGDVKTLGEKLFDTCAKIVERYRTGTAGLGIACDASGLIGSRVSGVGTSWMDAKVGDWVITPRQGRTVELNALWYNALRTVAPWCDEFDQPNRGAELTALADRLKPAFNRAFWHEQAGCCYDVVMDSGVDASIRPNQLLAIALPHPVLASERHAAVLDVVERDLLTPVGVRTLAPDDPAYQGRYGGDVVARDRAYHQGTVYPWLLGPYVSAMLLVRGRAANVRAEALRCVRGCLDHLSGPGLGQLCELFDGDDPHRPGGAMASVRSAGEVLRCYVEDVLNENPETPKPESKLPAPRPPVTN